MGILSPCSLLFPPGKVGKNLDLGWDANPKGLWGGSALWNGIGTRLFSPPAQTFPPSGTARSLWNCPRRRNPSGLFNPRLRRGKSQGHSEASVSKPPRPAPGIFLLCGKCGDGSWPPARALCCPCPLLQPGNRRSMDVPKGICWMRRGDEQSQPRALSSSFPRSKFSKINLGEVGARGILRAGVLQEPGIASQILPSSQEWALKGINCLK